MDPCQKEQQQQLLTAKYNKEVVNR